MILFALALFELIYPRDPMKFLYLVGVELLMFDAWIIGFSLRWMLGG
jgi:hypothetical protein